MGLNKVQKGIKKDFSHLPKGKEKKKPYYLSEQEEELISFIKGCAEIGYPKTVKDVLALMQQVLASCGVDRGYLWMVGGIS